MYKYFLLLTPLLLSASLIGQKDFYKNYSFSKADTLRGMLRPERTCYDVNFYDLAIKIDPEKRFIEGYTDIYFNVLADFSTMQIDLYQNMSIKKISTEEKNISFDRQFNAVFAHFPEIQKAGTQDKIRVYFSGYPKIAQMPPWDGGFVWEKDQQGKHWVGVACEGDGASLWWPNKDHLSDEPDSISIRITVPEGLVGVANGDLRQQVLQKDGYTRYDWFVSYPINNYNVTVNVADYVHFQEEYEADDGEKLALDYYVLKENLEKAKKHFSASSQNPRLF